MRAVISVIGNDRVGIIAAVSAVLADASINILDISQTTMQDIFTMIMLVDLEKSQRDFAGIQTELEALGGNLGLSIRIQHEDTFNSMHKI